MKKLIVVSFIFIVSCSDATTTLPENSEFERCINANIEIIRESGSPMVSQIPQQIYNLEVRLPADQSWELMREGGFDSAYWDSFQKSLNEPKNKSNILAHFALLQSSYLGYLNQIHLENDDNFYLTFPFFPEDQPELEDEYYTEEIFYKMHFYDRCDGEGCSNLENTTGPAEYLLRDNVNDTVFFATEKDFLDHFSNNYPWEDYNSLITRTPTFTLKKLLETEPIRETDEDFKFFLRSTLMSSTDEDLYMVAKRICHLQGIY